MLSPPLPHSPLNYVDFDVTGLPQQQQDSAADQPSTPTAMEEDGVPYVERPSPSPSSKSKKRNASKKRAKARGGVYVPPSTGTGPTPKPMPPPAVTGVDRARGQGHWDTLLHGEKPNMLSDVNINRVL